MAFVNEVVSDEDIDRYGLPFKKGSGRYWTRDAERDYYLWGGIGGNTALGEDILGRFHLWISNRLIRVILQPGAGSNSYSESPYNIVWDSVLYIDHAAMNGLIFDQFIGVLKEALSIYGEDGEENSFAKNLAITFKF
jgi:hypothetical protein